MNLLLALRRDGAVREVRLGSRALAALGERLDPLTDPFVNEDTEKHDYQPGFRPEDDGVVVLKYELPQALWRCRAHLPNDIPTLGMDELTDTPPVALVAVRTGKAPRFSFQAVDARNVLRHRRVLFFNPGGFDLNERAGLVVADRIDALHDDGRLYFRSEHSVGRFLDLGAFFREATDDEIDHLFGSQTFAVNDMASLKAAANTPLRRKLHAVLGSGRQFTAARLQAVARRIGMPISVKDGRVMVPTTTRELRDFVRILDDAYLQSMLDPSSMYLTTSKHAVRKGTTT